MRKITRACKCGTRGCKFHKARKQLLSGENSNTYEVCNAETGECLFKSDNSRDAVMWMFSHEEKPYQPKGDRARSNRQYHARMESPKRR